MQTHLCRHSVVSVELDHIEEGLLLVRAEVLLVALHEGHQCLVPEDGQLTPVMLKPAVRRVGVTMYIQSLQSRKHYQQLQRTSI